MINWIIVFMGRILIHLIPNPLALWAQFNLSFLNQTYWHCQSPLHPIWGLDMMRGRLCSGVHWAVSGQLWQVLSHLRLVGHSMLLKRFRSPSPSFTSSGTVRFLLWRLPSEGVVYLPLVEVAGPGEGQIPGSASSLQPEPALLFQRLVGGGAW